MKSHSTGSKVKFDVLGSSRQMNQRKPLLPFADVEGHAFLGEAEKSNINGPTMAMRAGEHHEDSSTDGLGPDLRGPLKGLSYSTKARVLNTLKHQVLLHKEPTTIRILFSQRVPYLTEEIEGEIIVFQDGIFKCKQCCSNFCYHSCQGLAFPFTSIRTELAQCCVVKKIFLSVLAMVYIHLSVTNHGNLNLTEDAKTYFIKIPEQNQNKFHYAEYLEKMLLFYRQRLSLIF
ncbi:uncharacterized protein LOC120372461 isoform X2 [Mauremys reevesii]|nr:uncharacterized protein LOC120372461 isoform X2 [Mauremys reevesii]XP_039345547.1 uncharacterized protein LOC120372461 isoform X2 [Mauremys reevesii]